MKRFFCRRMPGDKTKQSGYKPVLMAAAVVLCCLLPAGTVHATEGGQTGSSQTESEAEYNARQEEIRQKEEEIRRVEAEKQQVQSQIDQAQREKNNAQGELYSTEGSITSMEGQQEWLTGEMDQVNTTIFDRFVRINNLEDAISNLEDQLEVKQEEYDEAKSQEAIQYEAMKARIRMMYEKGDASYIELLITASSLGELLAKSEYIEKLYEYDRNMLLEYQKTQELIAEKQRELEEQQAKLSDAKYDLEAEKHALEAYLADLQMQYEDVDTRIAQARYRANSLRAQVDSHTAQINALVAEKNRKVAQEQQLRSEKALAEQKIEEARAAQARAGAAQAEAGRAASQGTSSYSGGSSSYSPSSQSSGSSYTPQSTYTAPKQTKTYSSPSGGSGSSVVSYASQFVGNPYVYGGTSLTNGADCSGFAMSVYSAFGYSLPRVAASQATVGTPVASLAEARAGDLVFYGSGGYINHVAIYCGDGTVVHASTAATGIKYSNAGYRAPVAIRRIIN